MADGAKPSDLEDRTFEFAQSVRVFVKQLQGCSVRCPQRTALRRAAQFPLRTADTTATVRRQGE